MGTKKPELRTWLNADDWQQMEMRVIALEKKIEELTKHLNEASRVAHEAAFWTQRF